METDYKRYVTFLQSTLTNGYSDGCGVVVGNLLITVGHLFDDNLPVNVKFDNNFFNICRKDALVCLNFDSNDGRICTNDYDIGIFKIDDCNSPLVIDDEPLSKGMKLVICSIEHNIHPHSDSSSLFNINDESLDYIESPAIVEGIENNFFVCRSTHVFKPGASGSPILRGNKLAGILSGGIPGEPYSFFLSAAAIVKLSNKFIKGIFDVNRFDNK